jgi:hypothetical protein
MWAANLLTVEASGLVALRRGRIVSLQIAILKILSGHPNGHATVAAMTGDLAILNTSRDWNDRIKRLATRTGPIDIFSRKYVLRVDAGWEITESGREFLRTLEEPVSKQLPQIQFVEPPPAPSRSPSPQLDRIGHTLPNIDRDRGRRLLKSRNAA